MVLQYGYMNILCNRGQDHLLTFILTVSNYQVYSKFMMSLTFVLFTQVSNSGPHACHGPLASLKKKKKEKIGYVVLIFTVRSII